MAKVIRAGNRRGYYRGDVDAKIAVIRAEVPSVMFDRLDYGFRLDVRRDDGQSLTVMQPLRDDIGQSEVNLPASVAVDFLRGG